MNDPIGYLITWVTYGTWLPGDARGWVEYRCGWRGWILHAVNCRSNHVHALVSAPDVVPKKIRTDLKAWATRCLKQLYDAKRENWWAERGNIRYLYDDESLNAAISYVVEGQDCSREA